MNENEASDENVPTAPRGVGDAVGISGRNDSSNTSKASKNDIQSSHSTDFIDTTCAEPRHWFVAIVRNNTEKASAEKLTKLGICNYLPIQTETKIWRNGRKATVNHVVISSIIFIYCTEKERREIVALPFINRFMVNKAASETTYGTKPLAIIPDSQIQRLRFMLEEADSPVTFTEGLYRIGDKVKVTKGNLKGLEGNIIDLKNGKGELVISVDFLGYAKLSINISNVKVI